MNTEHFVALLEGGRRTSRGWVARCPAHHDKSPSLSICEGDDGRLLIHCFSGCTTEQVCSALRLTLRDLFPNNGMLPHVLRRQRRQREAARHVAEKRKEHREAVIDLHREAEQLIRSARGIDISQWSNDKLNEELDCLADAHDILRREGELYESY